MLRIVDWSVQMAADATALIDLQTQNSHWQSEIAKLVTQYQDPNLNTDMQIGAVQLGQRLLRVAAAGLLNDAAHKTRLQQADIVNWVHFTSPPADEALQFKLADRLDIAPQTQIGVDRVLLQLGDETRVLGVYLLERLLARGLQVDVVVSDQNANALALNTAAESNVTKIAAFLAARFQGVKTHIIAQHNLPVWPQIDADKPREKTITAATKFFAELRSTGGIAWVLTSLPTRADAAVDGIAYADYAQMFFTMCDQPWPQIEDAQAHLIKRLDATKTLRFTNMDGTDLSMSVDGFTFCNSVIKRNIPGSEVFSAPKRDSVNGVIVANGKFAAKKGAGVMEDLRLVFENGYLAHATARVGQDLLDDAIGTDEDARYVGEIGIGTNPYLKQHVASILLAEKIGGSFHVALGAAYQMTDYLGTPVTVDNGNRSDLHWDITTMLFGKQGCIYADGELVMENGLFLDPNLAVLNHGWAAVPPKPVGG